MLADGNFDLSVRVATVVVPVALYFLILGLLNTRRTPQVLSGRLDFGLLMGALSPLFVVPVLHTIGITHASVAAACGVVACGILLLAPRGQTWVVYNASVDEAEHAVASALRTLGCTWKQIGGVFQIDGQSQTVHVTHFPLLRNVSVRFTGCPARGSHFGRRLARAMAGVSAEPSTMAVALLVMSMLMMVAPLAMMANQAGEIVRILTDLLN